MSTLDPEMTPDECRSGFEEIDIDGDGTIEFDEFSAWWDER